MCLGNSVTYVPGRSVVGASKKQPLGGIHHDSRIGFLLARNSIKTILLSPELRELFESKDDWEYYLSKP